MATYIKTLKKGDDVYAPRTVAEAVIMNDGVTTVQAELETIQDELESKAESSNPTFYGNVAQVSDGQYVESSVKSNHASGFSIFKLRDVNDTGYDITYSKADGNIAFNKTVEGAYDSTLLVIHPDYLSYKSNSIWHAGNDGAGSGLDADTLDGVQASSFPQKSTEPGTLVNYIWSGTQAQYDAITTKDPNTLYVVLS